MAPTGHLGCGEWFSAAAAAVAVAGHSGAMLVWDMKLLRRE
jgi:hypothetical protein